MYDPLEFWETHAEYWLEKKWPTAKEWRQIKYLVNPAWSVLELGCGSGRWSKYFPDYTGIDISPTLLAYAKKKYPEGKFFHHDMRYPVPDKWDLIFTFTSWLHVSPEDIAKVRLPDTNLLFVEPHQPSYVEYCFTHDYPKLFGVKPIKTFGSLTVYSKLKPWTHPRF